MVCCPYSSLQGEIQVLCSFVILLHYLCYYVCSLFLVCISHVHSILAGLIVVLNLEVLERLEL